MLSLVPDYLILYLILAFYFFLSGLIVGWAEGDFTWIKAVFWIAGLILIFFLIPFLIGHTIAVAGRWVQTKVSRSRKCTKS